MSEASRCFLCDGAALAPTERTLRYPSGRVRRFALACGFCGLLADEGVEPRGACRRLRQAISAPVFEPDEAAPFGLDLYTLRTAATRWHRGVAPATREQQAALRQPHSPLAAVAALFDLAQPGAALPAPPLVSIGALCRPAEAPRLARRLRPHLAWAREIVLLLDEAPADTPATVEDGPVRIAHRPLAGDFAAQRNALQALSRTPWMLQLDADESVSLAPGHALPMLAAMAERDGAVSIGLPRRNHVDGVLSDLRPDTQYRLNRRSVRFAGVVHERPDRPWQRSFVALCGAIEHRMTREHALRRSSGYEALAPGQGRPEEVEALLSPYRDA